MNSRVLVVPEAPNGPDVVRLRDVVLLEGEIQGQGRLAAELLAQDLVRAGAVPCPPHLVEPGDLFRCSVEQ